MTNIPIYSIILPNGMRGYLVLECEDENACRELILNEPHVKGVLSKPLTEEEISKMLTVKQTSQKIAINDVVEKGSW